MRSREAKNRRKAERLAGQAARRAARAEAVEKAKVRWLAEYEKTFGPLGFFAHGRKRSPATQVTP